MKKIHIMKGFLLLWVTLSMLLFNYYDIKVNDINDKIRFYELNTLFDINRFLIGGIYKELNSSVIIKNSNSTFEIGYFNSKSATYKEVVSHLLEKDLSFSDDLIEKNVYYPPKKKFSFYKSFWFWNAFGFLILIMLLELKYLQKDKIKNRFLLLNTKK